MITDYIHGGKVMINELFKKLIRDKNNSDLDKEDRNKYYADLYRNLVFSLIESYDYESDRFKIPSIKKMDETVGYPRYMECRFRNDSTAELEIYYKWTGYDILGLPHFIDKGDIDFCKVNELLNDDGIIIYQDLGLPGSGYGSTYYRIRFDASEVIDNRKKLHNDKAKTKRLIFDK